MTQLVPVHERVKTVRGLLEKAKPQIAMALPRHLTADRMLRVAMTCVQRNPRLLECTPTSLIGAVVQAAQLGLEPDGLGARAYLIPRKNRRKPGQPIEANFQVGYQGLMDLARRSKEIATLEAREVYDGDRFAYTYGLKPTLVHVPQGEPDESRITHVYALAQFLNGRAQFEVMTRAQIEAHRRKYSRAGDDDDSAWSTAWPSMAKKSVMVRLCKYLPASVELQTAVALAEHDESGLPQDLGVIDLPAVPEGNGATEAPKGALDRLAEKIQAEQEPEVATATVQDHDAPPTTTEPTPEPLLLPTPEPPLDELVDPRPDLMRAFMAELAKWKPEPTPVQVEALYKGLVGADDLTKADVAAVQDALAIIRKATKGDKVARARVGAILKG